ncbi:MAG: hypothetical protein ACRDND_12405 [Streptosporangiaceae bacterium]
MSTTTRTPAVPEVLQDPISNRGAAFSHTEREKVGLVSGFVLTSFASAAVWALFVFVVLVFGGLVLPAV